MNSEQSQLTVVQTAPLSVLVDSGRAGNSRRGITVGGPMDAEAFYGANFLCSNTIEHCCIESTMGGLKLKADSDAQIALAGYDIGLLVNGLSVPVCQLVNVVAGDEIEVVQNSGGLRNYLAIRGGFDAPKAFGSRTTVIRDKLGGLNGNGLPLKSGDQLKSLGQPHVEPRQIEKLSRKTEEIVSVRFVPGFQFDDFDPKAINRFLNNDYTITSDMDRMAIRLSGAALEVPYRQMKSEGISLGAIQIPPDGQPIIMLNDRQTIGGYPKLGSVISIDCNKLAQLKPGCKIRFSVVDMYSAHNLQHLHNYRLQKGMFQVG